MDGYILAACVSAVLIYREWHHTKQEALLLDRLMSRNLTDFKQQTRALRAPINTPPMSDEDAAKLENMQKAQLASVNADIERGLAELAEKRKAGIGVR